MRLSWLRRSGRPITSTARAERYVCDFDAQWLRRGAPAHEPFVRGGNIQFLADLGNSFEVVRTVRIAPVAKQAMLQLVAATMAPIVPLALTMMSLEEPLKKLLGILLQRAAEKDSCIARDRLARRDRRNLDELDWNDEEEMSKEKRGLSKVRQVMGDSAFPRHPTLGTRALPLDILCK